MSVKRSREIRAPEAGLTVVLNVVNVSRDRPVRLNLFDVMTVNTFICAGRSRVQIGPSFSSLSDHQEYSRTTGWRYLWSCSALFASSTLMTESFSRPG